MEKTVNRPENYCVKCGQEVVLSGSLSVEQQLFFHEAECDPLQAKKKATRALKETTGTEAVSDLVTDEDFAREVNEVWERSVSEELAVECSQAHY